VTDRKIGNNEIVLVDMGMDIGGYKSDLTRVFFLGKIARQIQEVCAHVQAAQRNAIQKIKAGALAKQVDYQARNYLVKKGLGKFFGHSLGHGVGLEIHEGPTISQSSPAVLKEGMVCTVEPAVYIPHKFGIRIEDMVLVTKNGCEVLSRHPGIDQRCPI
jgi:Xaa-Pro aminopeptidase